ncbi:hypothetical protein B0I35DRAFT_205813 [Stachybotrys elegans]|uniref:Early meiotic induction protein 1 n=1 Tax=Stachybotrys elegans TaxID=80388 RepID=A0A8K0SS73_9HYPO|nr:hypothetical protein B0I35DRAFT_205813 [Stachybotrys elegans]
MGWLWASSSKSSGSSDNQTAPSQALASPPPPPPPQPAQPTSSAASDVDPEIQKFMSLLRGETATAAKPQDSPRPSPATSEASSASTSSSWFSLKASSQATASNTPQTPVAPRDALSEALLPTEMSCTQAFDLAWACNSLGGQWNAVYRYGEMRSCSELWDDFWFCMRTKSYTGELKETMIRDHFREKEQRKYGPGKPSSEDVWESRSEMVPPGSCLNEKFAPPTESDEEWRKNENERRKQVRQKLGLDKP